MRRLLTTALLFSALASQAEQPLRKHGCGFDGCAYTDYPEALSPWSAGPTSRGLDLAKQEWKVEGDCSQLQELARGVLDYGVSLAKLTPLLDAVLERCADVRTQLEWSLRRLDFDVRAGVECREPSLPHAHGVARLIQETRTYGTLDPALARHAEEVLRYIVERNDQIFVTTRTEETEECLSELYPLVVSLFPDSPLHSRYQRHYAEHLKRRERFCQGLVPKCGHGNPGGSSDGGHPLAQ
jgi:hypothetical protein